MHALMHAPRGCRTLCWTGRAGGRCSRSVTLATPSMWPTACPRPRSGRRATQVGGRAGATQGPGAHDGRHSHVFSLPVAACMRLLSSVCGGACSPGGHLQQEALRWQAGGRVVSGRHALRHAVLRVRVGSQHTLLPPCVSGVPLLSPHTIPHNCVNSWGIGMPQSHHGCSWHWQVPL